MCREFPVQQGVPLDKITLSGMSKEERVFWEDFLGEAKQVIDKKNAENETKPFTPPASLKTKYQKAIADYNGEKYCQIRQLQEIFTF